MRTVSVILCFAMTGCSLIFAPSRHTEGDAGAIVDVAAADVPATDAPPCTDEDGDGFCLPDDCDDGDRAVYPGAAPLCGSAVREGCPAASLEPLLAHFAASEVGFTDERLPAPTGADRFSFALLPGTNSAIAGVVAVTDGTTRNTAFAYQNLARGDLPGEMGVLRVDASLLLAEPVFASTHLAMVPAYDTGGYVLRTALFSATEPTSTLLRDIGPFDGTVVLGRPVDGAIAGGEATALVANALGSDASTHVVYAGTPSRRFETIDANPASSAGYVQRPIPAAFAATSVRVRSSVDGAVVVQDVDLPGHLALFFAPTQVATLLDDRITGIAAPLRSMPSPVLLAETAAGLEVLTLSCPDAACTITAGVTALTLAAGESVVDLAGAPDPESDHSAYLGTVGLVALRSGGADRLVLVFADPGGVALEADPFPLPHVLGGAVERIGVGVEREHYRFDGSTPFSQTTVVGFGVLLAGATREVFIGSLRACEDE